MIKIKLVELDKHRNECAFRPYLWAHNTIKEIGVEFTNGDSYDYALIAQASIINKKVSLEQSVNDGLEFLSKIKGDYMILDGQDSTSLIGTYEVFKESNALLLLKNSLLKDRNLYKQGSVLGRNYWGPGDYNELDFGYTQHPDQHKCGHVLELDDGNYAIQPNNRLRIFDPSMAADPSKPLIHRLVNTRIWSVEDTSKWITDENQEGSYDYEYKEIDNGKEKHSK